MTGTPEPTIPVNVRIPKDVYEGIRRLALANDRTVSQQIRHALRSHIEASA